MLKQSGIKFQESACIILGADCYELTFGQISDVYIVSNEVLLQVHLLQTLFFSEHRHAFVVQKTKQMYFFWSTDIQDCLLYIFPTYAVSCAQTVLVIFDTMLVPLVN